MSTPPLPDGLDAAHPDEEGKRWPCDEFTETMAQHLNAAYDRIEEAMGKRDCEAIARQWHQVLKSAGTHRKTGLPDEDFSPAPIGAGTVEVTRMEYDSIIEELDRRTQDIQSARRGKYATDRDVLWNFNMSSLMTGMSVPQTIMVLMSKHYLALCKAVQSGDFATWTWRTEDGGEGLKQVVADLHIYLDILYVAMTALAEQQRRRGEEDGML